MSYTEFLIITQKLWKLETNLITIKFDHTNNQKHYLKPNKRFLAMTKSVWDVQSNTLILHTTYKLVLYKIDTEMNSIQSE